MWWITDMGAAYTESLFSCDMEQISSSPGDSSSTNMLSFGSNSSTSYRQYYADPNDDQARVRVVSPAYLRQNFSSRAKPSSSLQDHVIAERKRREKLNQKFIALSALIPNLKKLDKASVLEDSIPYIKQLQERVKTLEEQASAKKEMESLAYVKKFKIPAHDGSSSTDDELLPKIETRVSNKDVLIRIHCEKKKGIMVKALAEIQKLNLTVVTSNSVAFGTSSLDLTVVAQMDEDFDMGETDMMTKLRSSFISLCENCISEV